jgi:hypothetical protein
MHDHRTGPTGPHDSSDEIATEAATGIAALETWLGDQSEMNRPFWVDPARSRVASILAGAYERALSVSGLSEGYDSWLAGRYVSEAHMAGLEVDPDLEVRPMTPALRERLEWFEEHGQVAHEEGGVLVWEELPSDLRSQLYGEKILTVDAVRELAADHELQTINGIGPARARAILKALAATDRQAG